MPSNNQGSRNNADSHLGKPAFRSRVLNKPRAGMGLWSQTQLTLNYLNSVGTDLQAVFDIPPSPSGDLWLGCCLWRGLSERSHGVYELLH